MDNEVIVHKSSGCEISQSATSKGLPSQHELDVFTTMSKFAVDSKMYKGIGDQAAVLMVMLAARELNIAPMMALNGGLNIIQGKIEISARLMSALIRKAGHRIIIKESTNDMCKLEGVRVDNGDRATVSYTFAEAQKAGLVKPNGGWIKNPKDMCFARAMSRLARQLFSDVIGIGYVEGEIRDSGNTPVIPQDIEEDIETADDMINQKRRGRFLEFFSNQGEQMALEFAYAVAKHYQCSEDHAIEMLLADEDKLFEKYDYWEKRTYGVNRQTMQDV